MKQNEISKLTLLIAFFLALVMGLSACNIPSQQVSNPDELVEKALQTLAWQSTQQAVATMAGQLTQVAQETEPVVDQPTQTPLIQVVTATPMAPTQTPNIQVVTATPNPSTQTPIFVVVTATPNTQNTPQFVPTATKTPVPCNLAKFIKDVSIPDNTQLLAGENFTKTWRVQNVGSCTWTTDYDLVFVSGSAMNATAVIPFTSSVAPGQVVDLSVNMKAPSDSGNYTGYWMLRNQNDARFGVGDGTVNLWVKIMVKVYTMEYNFALRACDATWSAQGGVLPCPGDETSIASGYVVKKTDARREDGTPENELSLITRPDAANDGVITGFYPPILVKAGDQFRAVVNCEYNSPGCNVTFKLKYDAGGGQFLELGEWHELYEGKFKKVTVDLTPLAGKNVRFILYVKNNNTATNNRAMWILPSIWR